jgi:hypothetical protein
MSKTCIAWIIGMLVLSVASCQDYVCLFLDEPIEEDGGGFIDGEEVSVKTEMATSSQFTG